jgi:hypothetical protein
MAARLARRRLCATDLADGRVHGSDVATVFVVIETFDGIDDYFLTS